MGNLLLYPEGFLFEKTDEENKDALFDFLNAGMHARLNQDHTYSNSLLQDYKYSWGNFFIDFAYSNWAAVSANPRLNWISQTLYQTLVIFFSANPSGEPSFSDVEALNEKFSDDINGLIGSACLPVPNSYVSCVPSWYCWKANYYRHNQNKYPWKKEDDNFLPNKVYSEQILVEELKKHNKYNEIRRYENNIELAFHELVIRPKGPERKAYIIEIGSKLVEANYYIYDKALSDKEERAANGATRTIFKLVGRDKKIQYISLDHAHGMLEYHDHTGQHLGEYKFLGSYNSDADTDHSLRTL